MKKEKKYFRKVIKGDLIYFDVLVISPDQKEITFIKESDHTDFEELGYHLLSRKRFDKKLHHFDSFENHISIVDGASDRVDASVVKNALDLHSGLSDYPDLCKVRPEISDYFSEERIHKAMNAYLHDEISFFKLQYWSKLFSLAVMESFSSPMDGKDAYRFAVVKTVSDHLLLGKQLSSDEEIKEIVKKIYPEVLSMKEKYYRVLGFPSLKGE